MELLVFVVGIYVCFHLIFMPLAVSQSSPWFQVSYYPPINLLPVVYPLNLVDASSTNNLFAQQVYFPIEPVNDAVTNVPSVCRSLSTNPIPTDLQGHCFSMCTQYQVPSSVVNQNLTQLFCQTYALTHTTTFQQLVASHPAQPEYYYLNCTALDVNWHYQVATYDQYTLNALGLNTPLTSNYPMCLASAMCFHSKGLPISPWDGPHTVIQQPDTLFYCCRTSQATTVNSNATPYSVMYTYECVASLFDPQVPTAPRAQVTCSRTIQVNSNPPGSISFVTGSPQLLLQWTQTQFNCIVQCVYPYFTESVSFQNYNPQPTQIGCSPSDFGGLCLLNVNTFVGTICAANTGEQAQGLFNYKPSEMEALGFDDTGLFYQLGAGTPPPSLPLAFLFYALTWTPCKIGQLGCTVFCHCWNGCPLHPQCNSHGTYWEHPSLGIQKSCSCDPGYSGNKCQHQDSNQICGDGGRSSLDINSDYYVPR